MSEDDYEFDIPIERLCQLIQEYMQWEQEQMQKEGAGE